jgi:allophanate hydrolase subunit 1
MEKETKKLLEGDLNKIIDLDLNFKKLTLEFGKISIEKQFIEEQLSELEAMRLTKLAEFKQLQQEEMKLHNYIQKEYGNGVLDLETGMITLQ